MFGSGSLIPGVMYRWDIIHTHFLDGAKNKMGILWVDVIALIGDDIVDLQIRPRNVIDIYSAMSLFLLS